MPESLRLFIASSMPELVSSPLVEFARGLKTHLATDPHALHPRWIPSENWHLTWQFLGQTPVEQLNAIKSAMDFSLNGQNALMTKWQELAWWPSRRRPQILVGLLQNSSALQSVELAISQALARAGSGASDMAAQQTYDHLTRTPKKHKPFNPHITIARLKERNYRGPAPELPAMPANLPAWRIDEVTLFKSELHRSGAIHTPIHTVRLPLSPEA